MKSKGPRFFFRSSLGATKGATMPVCVGICDRRIFDQCHAKVWGKICRKGS